MLRFALLIALTGSVVSAQEPANPHAAPADKTFSAAEAAKRESVLLRRTRQLTFEGRRAGEGYFSADGSRMVFQSEREKGNPFYQIYLMDLDTGDTKRVSPGHGKTTCAWIHPSGDRVLFASTHMDPAARDKQKAEIDFRNSGKERRYSWDYDENFDLFEVNHKTKHGVRLTNARGYDAEGSWSPDGKLIAFASNRNAYSKPLSEKDAEKFRLDPAWAMDIFIMNADGSNVRQLTEVPGYDGGPFFSPDGKRICWRRFSEEGLTAEIMTMNIDGSDQRQLTKLQAMSWAPFYHPSGDYLIFTTNRHGFGNFELYLIDAEAKHEPVRVTYTDKFDGLPVFTPDGDRLAWTSQRGSGKSQIHIAEWNHEKARELLALDGRNRIKPRIARTETRPEFSPADVVQHVRYLCQPELKGRRTGTRGAELATKYVADYLDGLGLKPAGERGWFQPFTFTAGAALGKTNRLVADRELVVDQDWRPVAFSGTGTIEKTGVVFAGYGIAAPKTDGLDEYDSYVHLDVKDKWVLVFRFMPEDISPELRQHLSTHSSLRYKAMLARDKGARGLIFVNGPHAQARSQLVPLQFDGSLSGTSLPVISVTTEVAAGWLAGAKKDLGALQTKLDRGEMVMGFDIKGVELDGRIDVRNIKQRGRNVLGRLQFGDQPSKQVIVIGAHIDHLGQGPSSSSLARDDERDAIHFGADDNASGVAAMLEIAEYFADHKERLAENAKRDIIFAAWSGEELGLIGSEHFVKHFGPADPHAAHGAKHAATPGQPAPKHGEPGAAHGHAAAQRASIYPAVAACLNMDMVGRMEDKLVLQGTGSSSIWNSEIERRNAVVGLSLTLQTDSYLPTDASSFYTHGVPILSAFTGSHNDYHTPRDTPNKLNYEGNAQIARLMALVARSLVLRDKAPDYVAQAKSNKGQRRANLRAWLGTAPSYTAEDVKGVQLSAVDPHGPAKKAGLRPDDIIVKLGGRKIENIYDYTYAIEALKINKQVEIVVRRGPKTLKLKITPGSRD